jgi:NAD-dependent dihydropyrimidine dehydrogenase PreA subunit
LEEAIAAHLHGDRRFAVTIIPHVYDISADGVVHSALRSISHDFVLVSWLNARAAHWTLAQFDVHGRMGDAISRSNDVQHPGEAAHHQPRERIIYHVDLRARATTQSYLDQIERIFASGSPPMVNLHETFDGKRSSASDPRSIQEDTSRRWYPVIDYSRCTNCMECVDFCLFGVYGLDYRDRILVEQPDSCRKGCPACSRVCPESAIMFPQHKTPQIAGDETGSRDENKISLSRLFGAPGPAELAQQERKEQLRAAGRAQPSNKADEINQTNGNDELDQLIDELDQADL